MFELVKEVFWNTYLIAVESALPLLIGTVCAGVLRVFLGSERLRRIVAEPGMKSVVRASLFGVPLPLCSCSVLPVAMQLRKSGASRGATSSFLVSTPQTGVDSFMLTIGLINPIFAVARVISAFFTGTLAGAVQTIFDKKEQTTKQELAVMEEAGKSCCSSEPKKEEPKVATCCSAPAPKETSCCSSKEAEPVKAGCGCGTEAAELARGETLMARLVDGQRYAFLDLLPNMSHYYLIGFLATGVVMAFLPEGILESFLGGGLIGMFLMSVVGMVVYICAASATPLVAALLAKGMSPGTALVLLLAGPATSLASIAAVRGMLGNRGLVFYLLTIVGCAIGLGVGLDFFYELTALPVVVRASGETHEHLSLFRHALGTALLLYALFWVGKRYGGKLIRTSGKSGAEKKAACSSS